MTVEPAKFDEDGFLRDPGQWSEQMAVEIAQASGIGRLGEDHWRVLRYLRQHFLDCGTLPAERVVCREIGLHAHCMETLFSSDLKQAWRIAGLPNPGEEAKSYMGQRSTPGNP